MSAILPRLPHIQKFAFYAEYHRGYASLPSLPTDFAAAIDESMNNNLPPNQTCYAGHRDDRVSCIFEHYKLDTERA